MKMAPNMKMTSSMKMIANMRTTSLGTVSAIIFFFPSLSFVSSSHRTINQINIVKVVWSAQQPRGRPNSRLHRPIWNPLAAISDFAVCTALQGVRECPLRRYAGIYFKRIDKKFDVHSRARIRAIKCERCIFAKIPRNLSIEYEVRICNPGMSGFVQLD